MALNDVAPTKPVGRPKNNRLSALAAKRGIKKTPKSIELPSELTSLIIEKTDETALLKNTETYATDNRNGLSVSSKKALIQNLTHLASQVRFGPGIDTDLKASDLIPMTQGIEFQDVDGEEISKQRADNPSRGMGMLFPGRDISIRRLYVSKSLIPPTLAITPRTDSGIINLSKFEVANFEFDRPPMDDIMLDLKRETESQKRKTLGLKRLVKPACVKNKTKRVQKLTVDASSVRKILRKRIKEDNCIMSRISVIGPQSSGKSSLIGQLSLLLDDDLPARKKHISKLQWDAQKVGRPHDYIAWIVDELESERTYGRSRDMGELFVDLPSGKVCHLFDCPGDFDDLSKSADCISLSDSLILVVDVTSVESCEEKRRLLDLLRLIDQKSLKDRNLTVVLNKMDQCMWSEEVFNKSVKTILSLRDEASDAEQMNLRFLPISARSSEGIVKANGDLNIENEYMNHMTFKEILEDLSFTRPVEAEPQEIDLQPLVAVVKDVYENMGAGFTAVLEIKEGVLFPSQVLVCLPSGSTANVRTVQVHRGQKLSSVAAAVRRELVHVVLWHVDVISVRRGSILCDPVLLSNGIHSKSQCMTPFKTSLCWKAEILIHDLNGRSVLPGRQVLYHSFSFTCRAYIRRLVWVRRIKCSCSKSDLPECNDCFRKRPFVVSSPNVAVGVELRLDELHTCFLDRSINSDFTLYDGSSLFASGFLVDVVTGFNEKEDKPYDLLDGTSLHFRREAKIEEEMEVDADDDDS